MLIDLVFGILGIVIYFSIAMVAGKDEAKATISDLRDLAKDIRK